MTVGRSDLRYRSGFSLGEMLAAMVIASLVLTAVLSIYERAQRAASAMIERIDSPALADEVLQLMARDLDRTTGADEVTINIKNGVDNGFNRSQLIIRQIYHDAQGNEQTLYQITWQAGYDYESGSNGLILYRSYDGVLPEDKLFEEKRKTWEKGFPFVPVCRGVTFFQIEAYYDDRYMDQWAGLTLPQGVRVSLSWAAPDEAAKGVWVPSDDQKRVRTVAVDKSRIMKLDMSAMKDANESNTPKRSEPNVPTNMRR
jgi:prepilin-type N-terminal cleavage/methylation domain-containing protein